MEQAMQGQTDQSLQEQDPQKDADVFTVEGARARMNMPKDLQADYSRIVEAGMRVMFDKQTRDGTIAFLEEPGDMPTKLAKAITAVMAVLFKESNGTMPPQLVIPCAVELLLHMAAVASKGGMVIEKNEIAEAMANLVESIMKKFGVGPQTGGVMSADPEDGRETADHEQQETLAVEGREDMGYEDGLIKGAMR